MARPEKVEAVAEIKERIAGAEAVFVAEYAGLSVGEQQKLRRGLRAAEGEFKVVKMTLARRAVSELGYDDLLEMLVGPTGLAFASGDAAAAAKALRDFSRDHQRLVIKGGLLGSEVLPPERVTQLADIEPREVLLAKIAGAFQAPMAAMAGLLAAMPRALATMVQQLIDRGTETPDEPTAAEELAASEAPADEAETEDALAVEAETEDAPAVEAETENAPAAEATEESAAEADGSASSDDSSDDSDDSSDDDAAEQAEEE
jgi:large subunit ribosomal protein L10